jgi:hypothetical protein
MEKRQSSISIQTLVISAAAAVAAAVIVPMIWDRGTLVATAMTPVIVALVSEGLRKPAQAISSATPRMTRRSGTGAPVHSPHSADRFDPLPPEERVAAPPPRSDDPFRLRERRRPARHHWKLALATGAAAFAIAVVALTVSELVFGGAATRDSGRTTFFSGGQSRVEEPTATPTASPTATEEATPGATATPTPTPTVTAMPTPTPTVTPMPRTAPPTEPAPVPTPTP